MPHLTIKKRKKKKKTKLYQANNLNSNESLSLAQMIAKNHFWPEDRVLKRQVCSASGKLKTNNPPNTLMC